MSKFYPWLWLPTWQKPAWHYEITLRHSRRIVWVLFGGYQTYLACPFGLANDISWWQRRTFLQKFVANCLLYWTVLLWRWEALLLYRSSQICHSCGEQACMHRFVVFPRCSATLEWIALCSVHEIEWCQQGSRQNFPHGQYLDRMGQGGTLIPPKFCFATNRFIVYIQSRIPNSLREVPEGDCRIGYQSIPALTEIHQTT